MNYIGSKYSLIEKITSAITEHIPIEGHALDLFAGTTTVSQQFKKMGFQTHSNDLQFYSYITACAYLAFEHYPTFEKLLKHTNIQDSFQEHLSLHQTPHEASSLEFSIHSLTKRGRISGTEPVFCVLWFLQNITGTKGSFFHAYCEGGKSNRLYFNKSNGMKIQAIGDKISEWYAQEWISIQEMYWLRASLLEGADRVANTASVYGAFLKKVKKTAQKPLKLVVLSPIESARKNLKHSWYCCDASTLFKDHHLPKMKLTYIDPPYNHRQYSGNYHILETIARWDLDTFQPRGKTGLRDVKNQTSAFCSKVKAQSAFDNLFASLNTEYILFSYNNEGLLCEEELISLFNKYCSDVDFLKIEYNRFRADNDSKTRTYSGDTVQEFLILGKTKAE